MSRAVGSSPAEPQRESRDAGTSALPQKQLQEHLVSKPIPVKEKQLHLPASISWREEDLAALCCRRLTALELGTFT